MKEINDFFYMNGIDPGKVDSFEKNGKTYYVTFKGKFIDDGGYFYHEVNGARINLINMEKLRRENALKTEREILDNMTIGKALELISKGGLA